MMRARMIAMAALAMISVPAVANGPDLAGLWRFDMTSPQGAITLGAMTVMKDKETSAYGGKAITNGGGEALPIRSIEIRSNSMIMTVDSPQGPVVFKGDVSPSGRSFSGTLTYHDGRLFPMRGIKQEPLPAPLSASR